MTCKAEGHVRDGGGWGDGGADGERQCDDGITVAADLTPEELYAHLTEGRPVLVTFDHVRAPPNAPPSPSRPARSRSPDPAMLPPLYLRSSKVPRSTFHVPRSKFHVPTSKFQVPTSKFQVPCSTREPPSNRS